MSGHNYREVHEGVVFGYHDFQSSGWLRYPFIFLQTIDVNIATLIKIKRAEKETDILILKEVLDTLADIILDTGAKISPIIYGVAGLFRKYRTVALYFYTRSKESILRSRPELKHDRTLDRKISIYAKLATVCKWDTLDNNRSLNSVAASMSEKLIQQYSVKYG